MLNVKVARSQNAQRRSNDRRELCVLSSALPLVTHADMSIAIIRLSDSVILFVCVCVCVSDKTKTA